MNLGTLIKEALRSIISNKVRSFLTMLGIFIGVGAVIAMMSIGEGAQNSITNAMSALGTQTLYLTPGNFTENVRNAALSPFADVYAVFIAQAFRNSYNNVRVLFQRCPNVLKKTVERKRPLRKIYIVRSISADEPAET